MTGIDSVTTLFNQLNDMETEFRFHNLRNLVRILKIESHIRILRHQLSTSHESEFPTTTTGTFIFRIQTGQRRESDFALGYLFRIVTQSLLYTFYFFLRNLRFKSHNLHLNLSRNIRNTVLWKILEITANIGRYNLNVTDDFLLHLSHRLLVTDILANHLTDLRRSLVVVLFHLLLGTNLVNDVIDSPFQLGQHFLFRHFDTIQFRLVQEQLLNSQLFRNDTIRIAIELASFVLSIQTFTLYIRFQDSLISNYPNHFVYHIVLSQRCNRRKQTCTQCDNFGTHQFIHLSLNNNK